MTRPAIDLLSYAQNAEDIVLHRVFRDEPVGFYLDLGSGHPTRGSVTKLLHDKLRWNGVDIEVQTHLAEELRADRHRSKVLNVAVGGETGRGSVTFYEFPEDWALSTLDPETAAAHEARGLRMRVHQVPQLGINDILRDHHVRKSFEVLKVDIEGKDLEVLRALDFENWTPKVILAEVLCPVKKTRRNREFSEILEPAGYQEKLFDGINSFFLHESAEHLSDQISVGANALDRFIHLRWWEKLPSDVRRSYPHLAS